MAKTTTTWKKAHEFEAEHEGNKIQMDGSTENGHGPKALLLSALAGCSGIDVVDILTKMRMEFSDFTIEVEADQTDEHPRVFKDIHIIYKMKTAPEKTLAPVPGPTPVELTPLRTFPKANDLTKEGQLKEAQEIVELAEKLADGGVPGDRLGMSLLAGRTWAVRKVCPSRGLWG